ncbi:hypothetical protein PSHT_11968 [Puccinia striiformis]|uniref:Uncharacterized protein n=1 Tax=Puccinia striiformis TaxID=27350 RepID=A0A2S4UZQ3_9BASI|nr:hypothetical protein PSHT_11968 [Puccinia striiformis]
MLLFYHRVPSNLSKEFDSQNSSTKAKALNRVEVTRSVGGLQAFVRAGLIRKKIVNQKKALDFIQPMSWAFKVNVVAYLPDSNGVLGLCTLTRGFLVQHEFFKRLMHYHNQMDKVIKVQSVYRSRQQASQYKALTRQTNVPISAIKVFLHLLNDSDLDFQGEIVLSRLRTEVVHLIRDNQQLDGHVNELDTKIALLVKNKITLDEVQRTSGGVVVLNLPLPNSTADDQDFNNLPPPKRSVMVTEKVKKVGKGVVLTLFGYTQMHREEFLLLKLFQRSIHEELAGVVSLSEFIMGKFTFINLLMQYGRGAKEHRYLKDLLGSVINETHFC